MLEATLIALAGVIAYYIRKIIAEEKRKIEHILLILLVGLFSIHTVYFPLALPLLVMVFLYYRTLDRDIVFAAFLYILFLSLIYKADINFIICLIEAILLAWVY